MAFTVIYDACVLHPAPLRDLLVRIGMTGVVRVRWTERILDECFRSILRRRPDLDEQSLARTRDLMRRAIPNCLVEGYEHLETDLELPDPDDRHVLAAAIRCGAQSIVTFNLKDFPGQQIEVFGVEAVHPDDFVMGLIDLAPGAIATVIAQQAGDLRHPPMTVPRLLDLLHEQGLVESVARLKGLLS